MHKSERAAAIGILQRLTQTLVLIFSGLVFALAAPARAQGEAEAPVRGVVRPVEQAVISTELQAIAARVPFKEGDRFAKGEVLVEFDCRKHNAELASAEAVRREMEEIHNSNLVLNKRGAVSKHDLKVSKIRAEKAAAEAEALKVRVAGCSVAAPFPGRISELAIRAHEAPVPGKPFMQIVNDSQLEVELIVPSAWLKWLTAGSELNFTVDETRATYLARISRVGAAVDPVSQTVKVVATFAAKDDAILPGMSGDAEFQRPAQ